MKKKIAFVYHYFAHYRKPVFDAIINDISDEFDVAFFSDSSSNEPSLKVMSFDKNISYNRVQNRWIGKFLWQSGLFSSLNKFKPDVVICLGQFNFLSTWVISIIYRFLGKKVFFWGHGLYGNEIGIKKIVRSLFNKLPHGHMLYGHRARNLMIESGISADKIKVIYNSLDYENHIKIRKDLNIDTNILVRKELFPKCFELSQGFFVGRLTKVKRLDLILHALFLLKSNGTIINFIFIGDGPEKNNLKLLVKKYGLSRNIKFLGACHDEFRVAELIYSSDFCLSPGNVGLTAIHSLTFGTPVITHNEFSLQMPEYEAISHNVNGSFYVNNDINSLTSEISKWTSLSFYDREEIRKKCFSSIDNIYTPKSQTKIITSFLREII